MYKIRNVTAADLAAVTELEAACFPPAEAAGEKAFAYRIAAFPERFFVAEREGEIIGLINGCASCSHTLTDDLYAPQGHEPEGKNQMIFGLAVHPDFRRQGIGAALMNHMIRFAEEQGMEQVILTCKPEKRAYYAKFGFRDLGVSQSSHGGALWHEMKREKEQRE